MLQSIQSHWKNYLVSVLEQCFQVGLFTSRRLNTSLSLSVVTFTLTKLCPRRNITIHFHILTKYEISTGKIKAFQGISTIFFCAICSTWFQQTENLPEIQCKNMRLKQNADAYQCKIVNSTHFTWKKAIQQCLLYVAYLFRNAWMKHWTEDIPDIAQPSVLQNCGT